MWSWSISAFIPEDAIEQVFVNCVIFDQFLDKILYPYESLVSPDKIAKFDPATPSKIDPLLFIHYQCMD